MEWDLKGAKAFAEKAGFSDEAFELQAEEIRSSVTPEMELQTATDDLARTFERVAEAAKSGNVLAMIDVLCFAEESAAKFGFDMSGNIRDVTALLTPEQQKLFKKDQEQRKIWTPPQALNRRCCVKWLADGKYQQNDELSPAGVGCSGICHNRAHPQITLSFSTDGNKTVAAISHELDPFIDYFESKVAKGEATLILPITAGRRIYHLDGFIRPHLEDLQNHGGFGSHLVNASGNHLRKSDKAEEEENEGKLLIQNSLA